jgi:hypothetical protein
MKSHSISRLKGFLYGLMAPKKLKKHEKPINPGKIGKMIAIRPKKPE